MAKSRYIIMKDSLTQTTNDGIPRVDIFSFPIQDFRQNDVLLDWTLSEEDVFRFDQFIRKQYGSIDYYLGMTKWLNNLFEMDERHIGKKIKLYSKRDLDSFLRESLLKIDKG